MKERYSFTLDRDLVEWAKRQAEAERRSLSNYIETIIYERQRSEKPEN